MATWFERHLENTLRLHREMRQSGVNSAESDEIRDELDVSWKQLSESEQKLVGDVSQLVNDIEDRERVLMRALEIATLNDPSPFSTAKRWITQAESEIVKERDHG